MICVYVTHEQNAHLEQLSAETRVPKSVYVREALDVIIERYPLRLD